MKNGSGFALPGNYSFIKTIQEQSYDHLNNFQASYCRFIKI
ncbi:MAG: hypothetical protein ACYC25_05680 [Paludibacter sp.]